MGLLRISTDLLRKRCNGNSSARTCALLVLALLLLLLLLMMITILSYHILILQ